MATVIDVPAAAIEEMRALYRELDEEVARVDASCKRCGECCHFGSSGLMLYMGPIEGAIFFDGVSLSDTLDSETCPHLADRNCTNRQARSIGCRTYLCNDADKTALQGLYEEYLSKAKRICERFGINRKYVSLSEWIERLGGRRGPPDAS